MDAKHPKNDTLRWTAEVLYKLIKNGDTKRVRPEEAEREGDRGILRGEALPVARGAVSEGLPHPSFDRDRQPVHDMFSVVDAGRAADGEAAAFGSSLSASAPDGLSDETALFDGKGDDPLFGDEDGDYLFGGMHAPPPDEGPGGGSYGGIDDDVIVYNPSDTVDGGEDVNFLLVKEPAGVKIDDLRLETASSPDGETSNAGVIIYGAAAAGLTSLKALADIGITVDDGKISVDAYNSWIWGAGDARGGYTTFTGSDNEGNKLTVDVPTADLKKIDAAG
jgi:hypothetical protein